MKQLRILRHENKILNIRLKRLLDDSRKLSKDCRNLMQLYKILNHDKSQYL